MKRCPHCSQVYTDDMRFCLSDGTPLVALLDESDEPTVVRPARAGAAAERTGSGLLWKILAGVLALLLGLAVLAGVAAWIFWPREAVVIPANNSIIAAPTPKRTPTPAPTVRGVDTETEQRKQEKLELERKRLAEERRRLEEEKRTPPATPEPPQFNDPGTTRITFKRGRMGETVSAKIARQRSFTLRTLGGQYLSAAVRSPDGCVTFIDGGTRTEYTTSAGDSLLYLKNNCAEPSAFTLRVSVR